MASGPRDPPQRPLPGLLAKLQQHGPLLQQRHGQPPQQQPHGPLLQQQQHGQPPPQQQHGQQLQQPGLRQQNGQQQQNIRSMSHECTRERDNKLKDH